MENSPRETQSERSMDQISVESAKKLLDQILGEEKPEVDIVATKLIDDILSNAKKIAKAHEDNFGHAEFLLPFPDDQPDDRIQVECRPDDLDEVVYEFSDVDYTYQDDVDGPLPGGGYVKTLMIVKHNYPDSEEEGETTAGYATRKYSPDWRNNPDEYEDTEIRQEFVCLRVDGDKMVKFSGVEVEDPMDELMLANEQADFIARLQFINERLKEKILS